MLSRKQESNMGNSNAALTLHVYPKNILGRTINVTDASKTNTFITIDVRNRKPNMTFHATTSGGGSTVVATASTRMAKSIEIHLKGQPINIPISNGWMNTDFAYKSPALGGSKVTWSSKSVFAQGGIVCLDDKGMPLAKFNQKYCVHKSGTVEFSDGRVLEPALVEELTIVGLAIAEYRTYQSGVVVAIIS
jgi:hypothetical protein